MNCFISKYSLVECDYPYLQTTLNSIEFNHATGTGQRLIHVSVRECYKPVNNTELVYTLLVETVS